MNQDALLSLLQFSDGLFPAGGYAHSFGLETYVQAGTVKTAQEVAQFIHAYLEGSAGPCDAVAVVSAMSLAGAGDLEGCFELDRTLEAMKTVGEFREASRQMGRHSLRVAVAVLADPPLRAFYEAAELDQTPGHHPVAFGLIGGQLSWPRQDGAAGYLYSTVALLVGAAQRLLPLGQLEGQRIIRGAAPTIARLARAAVDKKPDDLWSFVPGIEIAGMEHATLEARLFRS